MKLAQDSLYKQIIASLKSVRLTALLISALLFIYLLGLLIPQKSLLTQGEKAQVLAENHPLLFFTFDIFGLFDIYTSPIAIFVLTLFFLNLIVVFVSRSNSLIARCNAPVPRPVGSDNAITVEINPEADSDKVLSALPAMLRGYKTAQAGNRLAATRNRYSALGLVLFHLSFILILIGGLTLFYTRSIGTFIVSEGNLAEPSSMIHKLKPHIGAMPFFGLGLDSIKPSYYNKQMTGLDVMLKVFDTPVAFTEGHIGINRPMAHNNSRIYIKNIDISLAIRMINFQGETVDSVDAGLVLLEGKQDTLALTGTPYRFTFQFYPDYYVDNNLEMTRSWDIVNPVTRVQLYEDDKLAFEGSMRIGEIARGSSILFVIDQVKYWGEFEVVSENGREILMLGMLLSLLGISWHFLLPRVDIYAEASGGRLLMTATGDITRLKAMSRVEALALRLKGKTGA